MLHTPVCGLLLTPCLRLAAQSLGNVTHPGLPHPAADMDLSAQHTHFSGVKLGVNKHPFIDTGFPDNNGCYKPAYNNQAASAPALCAVA